MLGRTEGIVLRSRPFGEADLILEYLTRDFGVRSAFAKSPRKIKSRFGGSLEPFIHSRISLLGREDASLPKLTQSDIMTSFQPLREDIKALLQATEFAELILKLLPEREPAPRVFELLLWALSTLQSMTMLHGMIMSTGGAAAGANASGVTAPAAVKNERETRERWQFIPAVFKARLLSLTGYAPSLRGCARCGAGSRVFYPREGALLCGACARSGPSLEISAALPGIYRNLSEWPLEKIMRIRPSSGLLAELKKFIHVHLAEGIAVTVKSAKFGHGPAE
ncbi:MAG: DNA repair protein RecO [Nitrospiraceae bacterium]|nr:DNA repair protein RecO [Nitrospiraceae bacterium]